MANVHTLTVSPETSIGDRLRLARIAAGLTQEEAARAIGLSPRTWTRLELEGREPRLGELIAIAQITGQDLEFFFGASSLQDGTDGEETVSRSAAQVKSAVA